MKHNPSTPNDGFSRVRPHGEIDCVPFAEHVNLAFDRIAVLRSLEQSSTEDASISGSQSQRGRKTLALWRPRGLERFKQYSDSF